MVSLLWMIALFSFTDNSAPIQTLTLSEDIGYFALEPYLRYQLLPSDYLETKQPPIPMEALKPLPATGSSFGVIDNVVLLSFEVNNPENKPIPVYLETKFPQLDYVLYRGYQQGNLLFEVEIGDSFPFHKRRIPLATLIEKVTFPPGKSQVLVFTKTTSSASVPLFMGSHESLFIAHAQSLFFKGNFYGVTCSVAFFAIVIFFSSRDRIYLYFGGYSVAIGMTMACFDGFGFRFWQEWLYWQHRSVFIFVGLAMLSLTFFSTDYLDINDRIRNGPLRWFKVFLALQIPILLMLPVSTGAKLASVNVIITYSLFSIIATRKSLERELSAILYLLSFVGILAVGIMAGFAALGLFGNFQDMLGVNLKVGNGLGLLMLSLGLGWRVRSLKHKERESEKQLLVAHTESQTKSEFLAQMSHELRTPMNAIIGMTEILGSTDLKEDQKKHLEVIGTSSQALLNVINSILDYSRLEAEHIHLEPHATDLNLLLEETAQMFIAQKLPIQIKLEVDDKTPPWIHADSHRLRQILLNLVGNAVKFTEHGSVTLRCQRSRYQAQRDLRFEIEDTGIGIPKDKIASLFEPFTQADPSTARKYGGTGLGLSICQQLVDLMGGKIGVHSEPGKGSCFWFEIPFEASEPAMVERVKPKEVSAETKDLKVLVVEDNKVNIKVITHLLKREGIQPVIAERGKQAIALRKETAFDLVFMDCEMPEMDGFETTQAIRHWEETHNQEPVPIFALTAHALAEHRQRSHEVGMNGHLSKPIQLDKLREVINNTAKRAGAIRGEIP
jgi:signal transduction histidine kinase/ActR/RegA family two-component response regulator